MSAFQQFDFFPRLARGLRGLAGAVALLSALGAPVSGCIVSDQDLPCRRDCECPSGQSCSTRGVCKSGASSRVAGDADGACLAGDTCTGTLMCLEDEICGEKVCRQRCSRLTGGAECPSTHVCQDIRTGQDNPSPDVFDVDAGVIVVAEGACVP